MIIPIAPERYRPQCGLAGSAKSSDWNLPLADFRTDSATLLSPKQTPFGCPREARAEGKKGGGGGAEPAAAGVPQPSPDTGGVNLEPATPASTGRPGSCRGECPCKRSLRRRTSCFWSSLSKSNRRKRGPVVPKNLSSGDNLRWPEPEAALPFHPPPRDRLHEAVSRTA